MTTSLSVVLPARNAPQLLTDCLESLRRTVTDHTVRARFDFVLIDDASDVDAEVAPLFLRFRELLPGEVTVLRTHSRQHYTRACTLGLSLARGELVLVLSHDMVLTPHYLNTVIAVADLNPRFGIVRGTSNYVDCFPDHQFRPPLPLRNIEDVFAFAALVARHGGLRHTADPWLTGDAMLIKRSVLDRIGVMDQRYFGYFGDIDFGLRAQRAGFALTCAKGAWLRHLGAGYYKSEALRLRTDLATIRTARMRVVNEAYKAFRSKWNVALPEDYPGTHEIDIPSLLTSPPLTSEYEAPIDPAAIPAERL